MNVEIVEFYPNEWKKERDSLTGTLRVKLSDIGIHILGIFVSKRNGSWFFSLPGRQSFDYEAEKKIRYPFIAFEDRDKQKELMAAIREKAPAFIEARLADTENPLIFPEREKKEKMKPLPSKNSAAQARVTSNQQVSNKKVWQDPPKRIQNTPHRNV